MTDFSKVLIANRGEIALRVSPACRELGLKTVAVYSTVDEPALHVRFADEAVCIGPGPAKQSYLLIPNLIAAAEISGADAVHPGYSFLAENAHFAEVVGECGLTWIGPPPEAIRLMGDKATAPRNGAERGVAVVPGYHGDKQDDARLAAEAGAIGLPLLVKASAGGGGKGMRVVRLIKRMLPGCYGLSGDAVHEVKRKIAQTG